MPVHTWGAPIGTLPSIRANAASYLSSLTNLLRAIDLSEVEQVVDTLRTARNDGASVYIVGNGGSAATASHFATDLVNMSKRSGKKPIKVVSLVDNMAWLTAEANDTGYDNVFSGQLETFAAPGHVLIAISVSGNSECVIRAVKLARARGMTTIGFLGFGGGALLGLVDTAIHIRSTPGLYGPVEDAHLAVQHIVSGCLSES
jgi:D-sedoheptulose 7-phosphate isomerase